MPTGWVFNEAFLNHDTGPGHPESAQRLRAINTHLANTGLVNQLTHLDARPARQEEILTTHTAEHWERVKSQCQQGGGLMDGDTPVSAGSWDAALLAAGGTIVAVDAVNNGEVDNAFCCIRPPGHHAEAEMAMGFCLFNNVAVAAWHLIGVHGLERVLIVDWDAHHGNGTQNSFYDDHRVFYFSTHQYPFYPGTGIPLETGVGEGEGFTLNVPLPVMADDQKFLAGFTDSLEPAMESFRPEFILLSAGFDAHRSDPLTGLMVSDHGFVRAGLVIRDLAHRYCGGKWVTVLEGGYELNALTKGVENLLHIKMGEITRIEE